MVRPEAVARPAATANDVQRPGECLGDEILPVGDFGAISPGDPPNGFGVPPKQLAERRRRDFVKAALRAIADHAVEQITAELAPAAEPARLTPGNDQQRDQFAHHLAG